MVKDFILIIPARLESTRLPKKLLINLEGASILERTYNCALKAIGDKEKIIIATDSELIRDHCKNFGANVLITSKDCLTGTDRVAEVSEKIKATQYINLQGDEPIFPTKDLNLFINNAIKNPQEIHTAVTQINSEKDYRNLSIPKMVFSKSNKLLYSSRAPIPSNKNNKFKLAYKHVCIYAFNYHHLYEFKNFGRKTFFENEEDLEINRFLELDYTVNCIEVEKGGKAVDTKYDLEVVRKLIIGN
tara:strand:+ start:274 stop:1008 length:735 start_codon:yes stop_codon:yes gene_type:complete